MPACSIIISIFYFHLFLSQRVFFASRINFIVSRVHLWVSPTILLASRPYLRASPTNLMASRVHLRVSPTILLASRARLRASPTILSASPVHLWVSLLFLGTQSFRQSIFHHKFYTLCKTINGQSSIRTTA
jgi:hypothetical protein